MSPPKHSLTKYITVLSEKSNKCNNYALCCYCKTRITNTKRLVNSHLESCKKFEEQYNEDERDRIFFPKKYDEEAQIDKETSISSPPPYGIFLAMIFCNLLI